MTDRPSEKWQSLVGPFHWYTLFYPPSWNLEQTDEGILLTSPDSRASLMLQAFWIEDSETADNPLIEDLADIFPQHREVRSSPPLHVPYNSEALEGRTRIGQSDSWWNQILALPLWKRFRFWTVDQMPLKLVATFIQWKTDGGKAEAQVVQILESLSFSQNPAAPPNAFAQQALQLAQRKFPLLSSRQNEDFSLMLGESQLNLDNFYRAYLNTPDKFESILLPALTTIVQMQGRGREQNQPELEQVRDRIMPMLVPQDLRLDGFPDLVRTPWIAEIDILYVVDESQAYWYINQDLVNRWNIHSEQLHDLALQNIDNYFDEHSMEFTLVGEDEGARMLLPNRPDPYNTTRILSDTFHEKMQELLGREFAVGIPSRDFFIAVSLESQQAVDHIREKVNEDYQSMDHPLTDRLLLVSTDGVSEYVEQ